MVEWNQRLINLIPCPVSREKYPRYFSQYRLLKGGRAMIYRRAFVKGRKFIVLMFSSVKQRLRLRFLVQFFFFALFIRALPRRGCESEAGAYLCGPAGVRKLLWILLRGGCPSRQGFNRKAVGAEANGQTARHYSRLSPSTFLIRNGFSYPATTRTAGLFAGHRITSSSAPISLTRIRLCEYRPILPLLNEQKKKLYTHVYMVVQ